MSRSGNLIRFLCGPLRIFAASALNFLLSASAVYMRVYRRAAEDAEITQSYYEQDAQAPAKPHKLVKDSRGVKQLG